MKNKPSKKLSELIKIANFVPKDKRVLNFNAWFEVENRRPKEHFEDNIQDLVDWLKLEVGNFPDLFKWLDAKTGISMFEPIIDKTTELPFGGIEQANKIKSLINKRFHQFERTRNLMFYLADSATRYIEQSKEKNVFLDTHISNEINSIGAGSARLQINTIGGDISDGRISWQVDPLFLVTEGYQLERFKCCLFCQKVFFALRITAKYCSRRCANAFNQRKLRQDKDRLKKINKQRRENYNYKMKNGKK